MVCAMPNGVLCVVRTWPLPLQSGQTSGVVPGAQPVPLQSPQGSMRLFKTDVQLGANIVTAARGIRVPGLSAAPSKAEDIAEA